MDYLRLMSVVSGRMNSSLPCTTCMLYRVILMCEFIDVGKLWIWLNED